MTGTYAQWTTAPRSTDTDVVGIPALTFTVSSGEPQTSDPVTHLALFAKLYDVSPDGTFQLPGRAISAARIPGAVAAGQPTSVAVQLPGIAHRFPKGHQLRVVLAFGDATYTGNLTARTAPTPGPAAATPGSLGGAPGSLRSPRLPTATLYAFHGHSRPRARAPRHPHGHWRSREKQQASSGGAPGDRCRSRSASTSHQPPCF